jgi:hypothetical protein
VATWAVTARTLAGGQDRDAEAVLNEFSEVLHVVP